MIKRASSWLLIGWVQSTNYVLRLLDLVLIEQYLAAAADGGGGGGGDDNVGDEWFCKLLSSV